MRSFYDDSANIKLTSKNEHLAILKKVHDLKLDGIFVGKQFSEFKHEFQFDFFETSLEAKEFLKKKSFKDTLILIKGSRGIKLEGLIDIF